MISVIVSIYKNLDNLKLILLGLERQTYKNFEVIISEDNDSLETSKFIENQRTQFSFSIKHVNQEDIGFRKTRILNKALLISEGKYIVFLDGDCIPHKYHLEAYHTNLEENTVCMGRRCYLDKTLTDKIQKKQDLKYINFVSIILHSKRRSLGFYIKNWKRGRIERLILGCNWGVDKQSLIDINGFDEDYINAGVGEDHDVDWRLRLKGNTFKSLKQQAIVYHLNHKLNYSKDITKFVNDQKEEKMKIGDIICKNGIKKLN